MGGFCPIKWKHIYADFLVSVCERSVLRTWSNWRLTWYNQCKQQPYSCFTQCIQDVIGRCGFKDISFPTVCCCCRVLPALYAMTYSVAALNLDRSSKKQKRGGGLRRERRERTGRRLARRSCKCACVCVCEGVCVCVCANRREGSIQIRLYCSCLIAILMIWCIFEHQQQ